jgi:beta-mannosidase
VKKHACLALWSGGNELFQDGMTEQSWALRLLNSLCYQLDRNTPFIYTSPIYGIGHGHYVFYDPSYKQEVFQWMPKEDKSAYTEFGVPGIANVDVLKSFIPENELFPPKKKTTWEIHHGFGAWGDERWVEMPVLEKYFGKIESLEEMVQYSQLLQCEGLKFIYEEARRQKPSCSMALNWCYQEPWPTAANNSLISWPNEIKPAYYHVANACRPVLASVRIPKFEWQEGEDFSCDLFMLNDTYDKLANETVKVFIQYDGTEKELVSWDCPGAEGFKNIQGPSVQTKIPRMKSNLFSIQVRVERKSQYNSSYTLLFSGKNVQKRFPSEEYFNGQNHIPK